MYEGNELRELARLAVEVALEAPLRPSGTFSARIPWKLVTAIRAEADRQGIPWARHHRQAKVRAK